MSEQDYLDLAFKELKGPSRKEGLWLVCLNVENGNEVLAAARYVTERAKSIQDGLELSVSTGAEHVESALSFSAVGGENVLEKEQRLSLHENTPVTKKWQKWILVIGAIIVHLVLGIITIDLLRRDNSVISSYANAWISGKQQPFYFKRERFIKVDRGHFLDAGTGIVWHRNILPVAEARRIALTNSAYRLPTLNELSSIVDCGELVARMQLDLVDYRYFKKSRMPHNGQCLNQVKTSVLPHVFGSFSGALFSKDSFQNDTSRVWGISPMDGGARLFEVAKTKGYSLLIKVGSSSGGQ